MIWLNFLHLYQPANQTEEILARVTSECYLPLVQALLANPKLKITLNINGALTERLEERVVEGLRQAGRRGQIEFTDSAKYHALLPFLSEEEIERQIKLNRETNRRLLGDFYAPKGFFPPEMGWSPKLAPILDRLGYEWVILDEIAYNGKLGQVTQDKIYRIKGTKLKVFFRERTPSNLIMSAMVRRKTDLERYWEAEYGRQGYLVTGMDGETFGHHRPGLHALLVELLESQDFDHAFFEEMVGKYEEEEIVPVSSTWASSQKDIEEGVQFASWNDPDNEIHQKQWELFNLVLNDPQADRNLLDQGLASDQFFWASGKPWWSLEQIELGAWTLLSACRNEKTYELYLQIIALAFSWQRTGKVRKMALQMKEGARIPFKDKTAHEPWVYQAFVAMMRDLMRQAAEKENFEEAILWRDAIWKLETKNDIFDAIHAVDLLRLKIPDVKIREVLDKYTAEYKRMVSGQPEQRGI